MNEIIFLTIAKNEQNAVAQVSSFVGNPLYPGFILCKTKDIFITVLKF